MDETSTSYLLVSISNQVMTTCVLIDIPEGRGICGLTALIILKEVLRQYQYFQKLPQLPRPSDVFDLAGGSGTGG